jgi:hypothetical protein
MNTFIPTRRSIQASATLLALPSALVLALTSPATLAAQDSSKTHTLFMGADIFVGTGKDLYPVKDVAGNNWVVDMGGKETVISAIKGPLNIKVTPSLKLTEVSADVAEMKSERGYTFDNDPITRQSRALVTAAQLNGGYQAANNQAQAAVVAAAAQQSAVNATSLAGGAAVVKAGGIATGAAIPSDVTSYKSVSLDLSVASAAAAGPGRDLETGAMQASSFDAMDVTFKVSSARNLSNPYVVTVTKFHPKDGGPGTVQNLVYAKSLDPIGPNTVDIHLLEGGFPQGFEVVDFQMHLYNRGEEVATTVSAKRVPLTRDEAFEYVKIEYEGAHKGETLAATPAMGKLPADLPAQISEGKYRGTLYVRVSKDGLAADAFEDPSCSKRVDDPYVQSVVRSIRFKPALEKGRPVEGIVPLNLSQLKV